MHRKQGTDQLHLRIAEPPGKHGIAIDYLACSRSIAIRQREFQPRVGEQAERARVEPNG